MRQFRWFILTIPAATGWEPALPATVTYLVGQKEIGASGYVHYQAVAYFAKKRSLTSAKSSFPPESHLEATKSEAALAYVWKEESRVEGSQFEFGTKPMDRTKSADWDAVWVSAVQNRLLDIPADIRIRCYSSLRRISADYGVASCIVRSVVVFYGPTGTGKSRRAWDEAGIDAYPKDPRSKFWCGYLAQKHVVIDEFRGGVDVAHLLRWTDRYPVHVEIKGSSVPLIAEKIWITSNLHPLAWYPELDRETYLALERRLEIILIE